MRLSFSCLVSVVTLLVPSIAWAADYDEAVTGDLSGDRLAPTAFSIAQGTNLISATSVSGDVEYFTVTVPNNVLLTAIRVTAYQGVDGTAFIGVQAGPTFTVPASPPPNPSALLGYAHFGPATASPVGDNVLDNMAVGAGSQGFNGRLNPGTYTFWTQQTGANASTYTLAFDVAPPAPVPVPPVFAAVLALGLGCVGMLGVRKAARAR